MKLKLFAVALLLAVNSYAQEEVNTDFSKQINTLFAPLEKDRVPHNLLLDYGMEFTDVYAFKGNLTESNYVNADVLTQIYNTLFMSRVKDRGYEDGFVRPETFENDWYESRYAAPDHTLALCGLYFKYSQFFYKAIENKQLTFSNNQLYDSYINGVWQNPYAGCEAFAITPAIQHYNRLNFNVTIPASLFYSNSKNFVKDLQIDFNNGQGFVNVPFDELVNVNYNQEGVYDWNYKLLLTNGQVLFSHSRIKIEKGLETIPYDVNGVAAQSSAVNALYSKEIISDFYYRRRAGSARLTIDLAQGHTRIQKPLIVAEGFDMGKLLMPEKVEGNSGYKDFTENLRFSNSTELKNLIYEDYKQYDIIYVDWENGVDYLQRNAFTLESVINWVNAEKAAAGSTEQNVVIGQSMGGVVARYALRDMEERGMNHDTRLFISHDAPQQGANIPVSVQYLYRSVLNQFIQTNISFGGIYWLVKLIPNKGIKEFDGYMNLLDAPATRQLLGNFVASDYAIDNSAHDEFYNELRAKGYPQLTRNLAISNGSECGATQGFNPGDDIINYKTDKGLTLLGELAALAVNPIAGMIGGTHIDTKFFGLAFWGLIPGKSTYHIECNAKAIPYGSGQEIFKLKISYTKKILWVKNVTTTLKKVQKNQPDGVLPLDTYGGGFYATGDFTGASPIGEVFIRDKFGFIPTPSGLDIGSGNITMADADYRTAYVGELPPAYPKNAPFNNFTDDFDKGNSNAHNQPHISFNSRNGSWLANELTKVPSRTNCAYACGGAQIMGESVICSNPVNYSAPWGASSYNWSVTEGASLANITAGNGTAAITVTPTANASGYVTIQVNYGNPSECGTYTLTKKINIGKPNVSITLDPNAGDTEAKATVTGAATPLNEQGITNATHEIISSSGNAHVDFQKYENEYIFEGRGKTNTWSKLIRLTLQNACGTTEKVFTIIPPPPVGITSVTGEFECIANNIFKIKMENGSVAAEKNYGIQVYDLYNVLIKTTTENQIDINDLPSGFYILKTILEQKLVTIKVFKK
jgi:hypothetical protein